MIYIRPKDPYKSFSQGCREVYPKCTSTYRQSDIRTVGQTDIGFIIFHVPFRVAICPFLGVLNIPFRGWKWWLVINLFLWCLRGTYIANPDVFQGFTTFHVPPPPTLGTIGCCAALWWWVARLLGPVGIKWQWFFASITQARKWPWKLLG